MRLVSWNVNGIRAISKKGFFEWMERDHADIVCIQETKCHPEQLTEKQLNPLGYTSYWCSAEKKGYSGVAVYTKSTPKHVEYVLGEKSLDHEGRTLMLEFHDFVLFNIYFPNGGSGNKRVPFKMKFYDHFLKVAAKLYKAGKKVIVCGDFNTAHQEIDLARPKENSKNTGFLPEEREWITKMINAGFIDTFRHFHSASDHYTWWDYKTKARERNVGWRIDYFFVSENTKSDLTDAFILNNIMGSDHCPLGITIK